MLSLLKLIFTCYLFILLIGVILSLALFLFDVFRWHDMEERVKITPSNSPEPVPDDSLISDFDISLESEVNENDS